MIEFRSTDGPFTPAELAAAKKAVVAFGWAVDGDCPDENRSTVSGRCAQEPVAGVNASGNLLRVVFAYCYRVPAVAPP